MKLQLLILAVVSVSTWVNGAVSNGGCIVSKAECTSVFSGFPHVETNLRTYTKQMLDKSFDFLLLSSVFDHYKMDRPGFEKMYRKISDKAWEDTIDLIKYQSKRGASVTLDNATRKHDVSKLLKNSELSSLKMALDYEKTLAREAHLIHKQISHADNKEHYDPDVAHYLDEKLIEYQSGVIRQLAGHITDLNDMVKEKSTEDLAIQMFDEYLEKSK
ncbi:soma ferritin-like [Toxorhynchites rutilus septentrionalis]|uniref:soma ferritin-like n=1 Tax=Toxorhynchites rutilus septentrionalis TaxID=329112 RepID=UPI00247A14E3|nr:soma ferritin-like [Toxorhynchites rutilus septentrionalis]